MARKLRVSFVGVCLSAVFVLASCSHSHSARRVGHGPPAHARAHGYRHKHVCGYELVYDAGCGVYVVVGISNCYYHDGHFYRLRGDVWEISLRADHWSPAAHASLPPGLRAKSKARVAIKAQARPTGGGKAKVEIQAQARPTGGGKAKAEIKAQARPTGGGKAKAEIKAQAKPTGKGKGKGYAKGKGKGKS